MTAKEIAGMIDIAAVQAENTQADIDACVDVAKKYGAAAILVLPAHVSYLREKLAGCSVPIGSVVGFPSGAESTAIKAATTRELIANGCDEVDMVNNILWLKSNMHDEYVNDVRAVVDAAGGKPVKVILECHWLTDEEIVRACNWCVEAGASWVKTGTGWAPTGATPERIALMKRAVGDRCQVKAAGGVRSLATLSELYKLGARRFGVGFKRVESIVSEAAALDK